MNIDELRQEIQNDEGRVNAVYLDHLSLPTIGIGHLVVEADPEFGLPVGTPIDDERINELFEQDIKVTISECEKLFSNFNDFWVLFESNDNRIGTDVDEFILLIDFQLSSYSFLILSIIEFKSV